MLYAENIGDDTTSNLSDSYILLTFLESPESNISLNLHNVIDKEDDLMVQFIAKRLYQSGGGFVKQNKLGLYLLSVTFIIYFNLVEIRLRHM